MKGPCWNMKFLLLTSFSILMSSPTAFTFTPHHVGITSVIERNSATKATTSVGDSRKTFPFVTPTPKYVHSQCSTSSRGLAALWSESTSLSSETGIALGESSSNDAAPMDIRLMENATMLSTQQSASELKQRLLQCLDHLKTVQERDGDFSIDFGVKGGELNSTDRAPREVNYYSISPDVGRAADDVMDVCYQLAQVTPPPIEEPSKYLGSRKDGSKCALNGVWRQLFTNSADGVFTKNSTRGAATARVIIDGTRGRINNVIDFATKDDGAEPVLKQLVVKVKASSVPDDPRRVALQFLYVKAVLTKFFFLPIPFGKKLPIYIPVPGPFLTRIIVSISNAFRIITRKPKKSIPKAYFDVLYLDDNLRIQKTAQGNLFVQAKESWTEALPYLK